MEKSTFTPLYESSRKKLVAIRKKVKLTQRQLAKKLGREHSFVARIEQGERRVDIVEFYWICRACKINPVKITSEIMRSLGKTDKVKAKGSR